MERSPVHRKARPCARWTAELKKKNAPKNLMYWQRCYLNLPSYRPSPRCVRSKNPIRCLITGGGEDLRVLGWAGEAYKKLHVRGCHGGNSGPLCGCIEAGSQPTSIYFATFDCSSEAQWAINQNNLALHRWRAHLRSRRALSVIWCMYHLLHNRTAALHRGWGFSRFGN